MISTGQAAVQILLTNFAFSKKDSFYDGANIGNRYTHFYGITGKIMLKTVGLLIFSNH